MCCGWHGTLDYPSASSRHSATHAVGASALLCTDGSFHVTVPLLLRHFTKFCERISPFPECSTLKTSKQCNLSVLRILQTPSPTITVLSPGHHDWISWGSLAKFVPSHNNRMGHDLQSRNAAAKLMHTFPSQSCVPLLTMSGMACVSSSSRRFNIPFPVRRPTIILGTPSRKDCAQNLRSLRSNFTWSRWVEISAAVLSSTQLMEWDGSEGLRSQTRGMGFSGRDVIGVSSWKRTGGK